MAVCKAVTTGKPDLSQAALVAALFTPLTPNDAKGAAVRLATLTRNAGQALAAEEGALANRRMSPITGRLAELIVASFQHCTQGSNLSAAVLFEALATAWRDDLVQQCTAATAASAATSATEHARLVGLATTRLKLGDGPAFLRHLCCCLLACPPGNTGEVDAPASAAMAIVGVGMSVLGPSSPESPLPDAIRAALALRLESDSDAVASSWKGAADPLGFAAAQLPVWRSALFAPPSSVCDSETKLALRIVGVALGFAHTYAVLLDEAECWHRINDVMKLDAALVDEGMAVAAKAAIAVLGIVLRLRPRDSAQDPNDDDDVDEAAAFVRDELERLSKNTVHAWIAQAASAALAA